MATVPEIYGSTGAPAHIQQAQIDGSTLAAMQQHIAQQVQQAAFAQIPDVVKSVREPTRTIQLKYLINEM
jgi:hypothetical protein